MIVPLIGAISAGLGLSLGLVLNVRLAGHSGQPVLASLINFLVGMTVTLALALLGVLGQASFPVGAEAWMWLGGAVGAGYVVLTLFTARLLGVAASTAGVTLGQILGARIIDAFGLLGQPVRPVSLTAILGAALLVAAVLILARERETSPVKP
ncbi:DMT family transporter [Deinococcus aquatilis]|uniref:DMT family transporter n=1 Tax=Deinococcus aquatilis TaxID=519440 RepID=UPI000374CBDA|nr:DMT family transporter [Deinococcus aquatilis]